MRTTMRRRRRSMKTTITKLRVTVVMKMSK
jgi:hypothetical protein